MHKKFIQKFKWIEPVIIYYHEKFEAEQKSVQE